LVIYDEKNMLENMQQFFCDSASASGFYPVVGEGENLHGCDKDW
jgi:hypothetical protein